MNPLIESKRTELTQLCTRFRVRKLELFGSAAGDRFDPGSSDLDFLVLFHPLPPGERANCYFGLREALEELFGRPVDLVELAAVHNPYFLVGIAPTRVVLYVA